MTKSFSPAILFVEPPHAKRGLPAFAVSLLLHGAVISVAVVVFRSPQSSSAQRIARSETIRFINLQPPQIARSAGIIAPVKPDSSDEAAKTASNSSQTSGRKQLRRHLELSALARLSPAKQTLIQLDAPPKLVMNQVAVPDLLLWTQRDVPPPRKQLVPPPVQSIPKPAQALLAPPTLSLPNHEMKVADLRFAQPPLTDIPKLAVPPATTTPIQIKGAEDGTQVPQSVSTTSTEESAAHIISLSSIPMRAEGLVAVPSANQISLAGNGEASGSGEGGAPNGDPSSGSSNSNSGQNRLLAVASGGAQSGSGARAGDSADNTAALSDTRADSGLYKITLPREGKFGIVVLGSSAADAYLDGAEIMTGKVVSTVYLKVGLRKNWILQYCLPGPVEQKLLAKGSAAQLDAPWPYVMVRPRGAVNSNADALMVHGLVNAQGHFEQLAFVLPGDFERKNLLLSSLKKWEFRPAQRDQQPIAVEVLLIIPGEAD